MENHWRMDVNFAILCLTCMNDNIENGSLLERFLGLCQSNDYDAAVEFQNRAASLIPGEPRYSKIETVCGLDIAFNKHSNEIYGAASVYSLDSLQLIEDAVIVDECDFPYIPGLFAFREGPAAVKLLSKIKTPIDLLLLDGQGMAHPRGAGLASIMGLVMNMPSVGSAKTRLVGTYKEPDKRRGSTSDLVYGRKVVGKVVRTRDNVSPIFISVGYMMTLDDAVEIVLRLCSKTRLAEPIKRAHLLANQLRLGRMGQGHYRVPPPGAKPTGPRYVNPSHK